MGRKIPLANDGTNYYQARSYAIQNTTNVDTNPCEEISSGQVGAYIQATSLSEFTLVSQPQQQGIVWQTQDLTQDSTWPINIYRNGNGTVYERTYTFETILQSTGYSPEESARLQEEYMRVPDDHEFTSNFWGQCERCPTHNMYRREMNAHLFVIQEAPSLQDWQDQLAS